MIDSNATVNGTTVWVSAGAEYNNDEEIWIGQASFETIVEEFVRNLLFLMDFSIDGPTHGIVIKNSTQKVCQGHLFAC